MTTTTHAGKEPKMSEILEAAAYGTMAPYRENGMTFSSADYAHSKSMAGVFSAIAQIYKARGL